MLNWFSPLTTAVPCLYAALLIVSVQTIDVHDTFYGMGIIAASCYGHGVSAVCGCKIQPSKKRLLTSSDCRGKVIIPLSVQGKSTVSDQRSKLHQMTSIGQAKKGAKNFWGCCAGKRGIVLFGVKSFCVKSKKVSVAFRRRTYSRCLPTYLARPTYLFLTYLPSYTLRYAYLRYTTYRRRLGFDPSSIGLQSAHVTSEL